jgi:hypothetical protein
MALRIKTCLELYDLYVFDNIKKLISEKIDECKYIYAPDTKDIGFRYLQQRYGTQRIFPSVFVFRDSPPSIADEEYSSVKYAIEFSEASSKLSFRNVNIYLDYNVSFVSDDVYDMNAFAIWYYNFRSYRKIRIDFNELGIDFKNDFEVFLDNLEFENTIDNMFEEGLYFKYYFTFSVLFPLFDVKEEITYDKVVLSLYNKDELKVRIE